MTPDELSADMEGRLEAFIRWLLPDNREPFSGSSLQVVEDLRALLKAYQEQRRALEEANQNICSFLGPWAVHYAADRGFPAGHLHPVHYDILEKAGARMVDFTRAALNQKGDER